MKTKVVNIKDSEYNIFIGRPSEWGNPFEIGKDGTRKEVIEKYRKYILKNKDLMKKIPELREKVLGCFCKPKACHGDILVELADKNSFSQLLKK